MEATAFVASECGPGTTQSPIDLGNAGDGLKPKLPGPSTSLDGWTGVTGLENAGDFLRP